MSYDIFMRNLSISKAVQDKLAKKHFVEPREIEQCFLNRSPESPLIIDDREEHATNPPTLWFLARTNRNRLLKVVYIQNGLTIELKTCYEPNETEIRIYLARSTK